MARGVEGEDVMDGISRMGAQGMTGASDEGLGRDSLLGVLNAALATELGFLGRRKRRYYEVDGVSAGLRQEFLERVVEEALHTDRLVGRIIELGGSPDFQGGGDAPAAPDPVDLPEARELIQEDLAAQRVAIDGYQALIGEVGFADVATRTVLEEIIRREQQHAERLSHYLVELS